MVTVCNPSTRELEEDELYRESLRSAQTAWDTVSKQNNICIYKRHLEEWEKIYDENINKIISK